MGRGRLAEAAPGGDILSLTAGLRRELLQTSRGSVDLGASFDLPSQMRWEGLEGEPEDEFASRISGQGEEMPAEPGEQSCRPMTSQSR